MGIKKFIADVIQSLGLHHFVVSGKKKSVKTLLHKLKKRRLLIYRSFQNETDDKKINELQEELDIVSLQIRKGKKLLNKLNNHSKD